MREIKNNVEIGKVKNTEMKLNKTNNADSNFCGDSETSNVNDFSNPSEVLGRSQLSKTDNLKADVAYAMANPETISKSDKLFEMAFKELQKDEDPNAYEKACAIATSEEAKDLLSK